MIETSVKVQITHIINPHLFWSKEIDKADPKLLQLEDELKRYAHQNLNKMCAAKTGNKYETEPVVVAYSQKKWLRAKIDRPNQNGQVVLWAIDYGHPFKVSLDYVLLLNDDLKQKCFDIKSNVFQSGIYGVMPSSKVHLRKGTHIFRGSNWSSLAVELFECIRSEKFDFEFTRKLAVGEHVFGNLYYKRQNESEATSVAQYLIDQKGAVVSEPEEFEIEVFKDSVNHTFKIVRWLDNDKKEVALQDETSKILPEIPKCPEPKSSTKIDQSRILRRINSTIQPTPVKTAENQSNTTSSNATLTAKTALNTSRLNKIQEMAKPTLSNNSNASSTMKPSLRNSSSAESSKTVLVPLPNDNFLVEKLKFERILMQNNQEEAVAVHAANFTKAVHNSLKHQSLQETYATQAYAWPNLLRGNSLVLVDSKNRGKTVAYLPPICSLVQQECEDAVNAFGKRASQMGAIAIIVCLTSSVSPIAHKCRTLLGKINIECKVVEAIGTRNATSVTIQLYNGCNILVTTAPCLMEMMQRTPRVVQNAKLKCVAFENLDCIMEKHADICNNIIKELCIRKKNKEMRQTIVTSRTWIKELKQFMNAKMTDAVLLIGNPVEAAIYAGTLEFVLCRSVEKLQQLTEYIQSVDYRKEKTLIICNEVNEAEQVAECLNNNQIPNNLVKHDTEYSIAKAKSFWEKLEGVLICIDEHLAATRIKNAQHIVHFSIPTLEYRKFMSRFSTMFDYYEETLDDVKKPKGTSVSFYTEDNVRQLPKLIELLTRHGQKIQQDILNLSQKFRELNRADRAVKQRFEQICNFVFMHGINEHSLDCKYRHLMLQSDVLNVDENQITSGTLRFLVLKVVSPTEYIVRPMTLSSTGKSQDFSAVNGSSDFKILDLQMQGHYRKLQDTHYLELFESGQVCVVIWREKYYRAQIVRELEKRSIIDKDQYEVRLVDIGEIQIREACEMFTLDESFKSLPGQAFNLHLIGITPADKEDDWDPDVCKETEQFLSNLVKREPDSIYEANVLFTLRNAIVVDIMRVICPIRGLVHCSMKKFFFNKGFAAFDTKNRHKLLDMVNTFGVKVATKAKKPETNENNNLVQKSNDSATKSQMHSETKPTIEPQVHNSIPNTINDSSSESYEEDQMKENWISPWKVQHKLVELNTFYNPNNFYVTDPTKTRALYEAINQYTTENINPLNESMTSPDIDKYCLVNTDGGFDRGKILDIHFHDEDISMDIFFVDIGKTETCDIANVFDIPDELIQKYPFQAIWCNLCGIEATENAKVWSEAVIDDIYNTIDEYGHELYLHTISDNKTIKPQIGDTNIVCHDVALLAIHDNQQINLNEMLIKMGLVASDPNTIHKLENIPNILDEDEDWDEECDEYEVVNSAMKTSTPLDSHSQSDSDDCDLIDNFDGIQPDQFKEFLEGLSAQQSFKESSQQSSKPLPQMNITDCIHEENEDEDKEQKSPLKRECQKKASVPDANVDDFVDFCADTITLSNKTDGHKIEYIYNHPKMYWQQNDEMIVLKIGKNDDAPYGLEVTENHLIYGSVEDGVKKVAIINFFGFIDYEHTIHEVKGLNVVVRLRKSCPILWPHLLHVDEKRNWLQLENTSPDDEFEYFGYTTIIKRSQNEEDDEDSPDLNESYEWIQQPCSSDIDSDTE